MQRGWIECFVGLQHRVLKSLDRIRFWQWANIRETEQSFGIGFRLAHQTGQNWQTSGNQHDRKLTLLHLVHRHDECAQFRCTEILNFVDQQSNRHATLLSSFANGHKEAGEIDLQITAIGSAGLRLNIQSDINIADFNLDRPDKTFEHCYPTPHLVACSGNSVQIKQQSTQMRRKQNSQRLTLVGLNKNSAITGSLGYAINFIEQHSLSDAT